MADNFYIGIEVYADKYQQVPLRYSFKYYNESISGQRSLVKRIEVGIEITAITIKKTKVE